jgi:hypothetical protein
MMLSRIRLNEFPMECRNCSLWNAVRLTVQDMGLINPLHDRPCVAVEVNAESFTAVDSVSSGDVTLTAAALVAAQPGQRIVLGLPLFAGRVTWLGDEKAVFSQLLGPEGCTAGMTGGAPLGPDPSPAGASGNGAGASSLSLLPGALLAAAVAACWLVYH